MPRPFRFAVINETMFPAVDWLAHVRRVEELGYSTFLIRDHFVPDFFGDQLAPFSALMAAAMATTRLRVGTMVLDNDYRHPVILAKEAATLDMLSGGRLELGLGAGWLRTEYERAGMEFERAGTRIDRLEESLSILKGLVSGEPVHHEGEHYAIDGLTGYPLPRQRPHPPILIGGGKRRVLTLAGREADIVGILTSSVASGALFTSRSMRGALLVPAFWYRLASNRERCCVEKYMSDEQLILNIIGDKVALGPLRRDLIPLYARWQNDFYVQRTFGQVPQPISIEARTARFEEQATTTEAYWFTIYEKETLRPIGTTDLFDVDFRMRFCTFGMMIGEAEGRGKGYGTEVVRLMLDYAFTALGLNNVMLTVSEYNLAGRRAYEKAGFKEFGRRREADVMGGVAYNEIYMDYIASEFDSPVLGRIFTPDVPR